MSAAAPDGDLPADGTPHVHLTSGSEPAALCLQLCGGRTARAEALSLTLDPDAVDRLSWALQQLPRLRQLRLLDSCLPGGLRALGSGLLQLRVLSVSGCRLDSLDGISALPGLQELHAAHNQLIDVSPCSCLDRLQVLDVADNQLSDATSLMFLGACTELRRLEVGGNPLCADAEQLRQLLLWLPQLHQLNGQLMAGGERAQRRLLSAGHDHLQPSQQPARPAQISSPLTAVARRPSAADAVAPAVNTSSSVQTTLLPMKSPSSPVKAPHFPIKVSLSPVKAPLSLVKMSSTARTPISPAKTPISPVKTPMSPVKTPISPVKTQISPVKTPMSPVKTPMSPVQTAMSPVKASVTPVHKALANTVTASVSGCKPPTPLQKASMSPSTKPLSPAKTLSAAGVPPSPVRTARHAWPARRPAPAASSQLLSRASGLGDTSGGLARTQRVQPASDPEWCRAASRQSASSEESGCNLPAIERRPLAVSRPPRTAVVDSGASGERSPVKVNTWLSGPARAGSRAGLAKNAP